MCTSSSTPTAVRRYTKVDAASDMIAGFKISSAYIDAQLHLPKVPDFSRNKVLSFKDAALDCLMLEVDPLTTSGFSYYVNYFSPYIYSKFALFYVAIDGDPTNFINFSGTIKMYYKTGKQFFDITYSSGQIVSWKNPYILDPTNPSPFNYPSYGACVAASWAQMMSNTASAIICSFAPEECLAAVLLHCALEHMELDEDDIGS